MNERINLPEIIKSANVPGSSVATNTGERYHAGVTDLTNPNPVNNETIFMAASLSKPVFSYIVLKLIEESKIRRNLIVPESNIERPFKNIKFNNDQYDFDLDKPLYTICPNFGPPDLKKKEFEKYYQSLTAGQILSHQAGLTNEFGSEEKIFEAEPGTRFNYSGFSHQLLADVIERITNETLSELSQIVFKNLKMHNTSYTAFFKNNDVQPHQLAVGHNSKNQKDEKSPFLPNQAHPAASLRTTADDYIKFLNACITDKFIHDHMFVEHVQLAGNDNKAKDVNPDILANISWGLGIGILKTDHGRIAFHWGDNNTFRAFCAINLDDIDNKNAVVCLTNSMNGPEIYQQVVEPFVGDVSKALDWLKLRGDNIIPKKNHSVLQANSMFAQQENRTTTNKIAPDVPKGTNPKPGN